jgi:signal transduction histidine kinase
VKTILIVDDMTKTQEVLRKLEALIEFGYQTASERDPLKALDKFVRNARDLLGARYAGVIILNDTWSSVERFRLCGWNSNRNLQLSVPSSNHPILQHVVRYGGVIRKRAESDCCSWDFPEDYPPTDTLLAVPVFSPARRTGMLFLTGKVQGGEFTPQDEKLAGMLGAQIGVAYENLCSCKELDRRAKLLEREVQDHQITTSKLKESTRRLQALSHRLLDAQEQERRRIARELHDEVGQGLTAAKMYLAAAGSVAGPSARTKFEEIDHVITGVFSQIRDLSLELRPSILDDIGLVPALRWYFDRHESDGGIRTEVVAEPAEIDVPPEIATACFRIAQEALTNSIRHGKATRVKVDVRLQGASLQLTAEDNGIGFRVAEARARAAAGQSMGLLSMEERAHLLGGDFFVQSTPGEGTTMHAKFPLGISE